MYNVIIEHERVIYMLIINVPSLLIGLVLGIILTYAFKKGDRNE